MTKNSNEIQTYKINLGFQPSNINVTVTSIVCSSAGSLRICLSPPVGDAQISRERGEILVVHVFSHLVEKVLVHPVISGVLGFLA